METARKTGGGPSLAEIARRLGRPGLWEELRRALAVAMEGRLKEIVLYGSQARGEAHEDSDVDLLVVLEGPVNYGADLQRIIDATHEIQLGVGAELAATPVDESTYNSAEWPLYRRAHEEGLAI